MHHVPSCAVGNTGSTFTTVYNVPCAILGAHEYNLKTLNYIHGLLAILITVHVHVPCIPYHPIVPYHIDTIP